ncbi:MAG: RDD family protein [Verrucomicrobia bacterium]|nr:RDD family protein [Verrucomicrobiota bacterium]
MPAEPTPSPKPVRVVTADTLTVAPAVLGRPLAEPQQRLVGMLIDLAVVGALSLLAKPFLGLATGVMLIVLFGTSAQAPKSLRVLRWVCRIGGAAMILLAVLNFAKSSEVLAGRLHLEALETEEVGAPRLTDVTVSPTASAAELRAANRELAAQVETLKDENRKLRATPHSLVTRTQATIRAMGVTFGWAGVYFTLAAGLTNGRTLGKLIVRTRAVKINGTPLKFFDAFIRQGGYVAGVAMGLIGFLKLLWEPNRQAVEDRIASTVVVKA